MTDNQAVISRLTFTAVSDEERESGLLGFVTFDICGIVRLDGVALRRSREGRRYLSFPQRRDAHGQSHELIRPLTDTVRREIERQVLAAVASSNADLQRKGRHA